MLRHSNGFTLLEVLAALVIWMIIASILLPGLVRMNQEREGFLLEQQARFLLTLELEDLRVGKKPFEERNIEQKGELFHISLDEETDPIMLCVSYTDYRHLEKERCAYVLNPKR